MMPTLRESDDLHAQIRPFETKRGDEQGPTGQMTDDHTAKATERLVRCEQVALAYRLGPPFVTRLRGARRVLLVANSSTVPRPKAPTDGLPGPLPLWPSRLIIAEHLQKIELDLDTAEFWGFGSPAVSWQRAPVGLRRHRPLPHRSSGSPRSCS